MVAEGCLNIKLKIQDESTIVSGNNNLILVSGNYGLIFLFVVKHFYFLFPFEYLDCLPSLFLPIFFINQSGQPIGVRDNQCDTSIFAYSPNRAL